MIAPADLLTLNAYEEARGEPDDGVAAVCKVTLNRQTLHYASDGTMAGTVLRHAAFSWTEFSMDDGVYERVAYTPAAQLAHVEACLVQARADEGQWARCSRIAAAVTDGSYATPLFRRLTPDTVLYYAPSGCPAPAWARPLGFVIQIGKQRFFRDITRMATPPTQIAEAWANAATKKALQA